MKNVVIIGASGAIGSAFVRVSSAMFPEACVHAFSRTPEQTDGLANVTARGIDYYDESSLEQAAQLATEHGPIDFLLVALGMLHDEEVVPEKSLRDLSAEKFRKIYDANTIAPALVAKYFLPGLNREQRSVCAFLSAHAGSISDNDLGGWYSYRCAKAALNMLVKNFAIEVGRRNKQAVIVGLHPGTVDSNLSSIFKAGLPAHKLFAPEYSAQRLMDVLKSRTPEHSGRCFSWDASQVLP
jgi:NAD(P)-dependent dehydrogenase (short-subunit alcohol dehydrogenase family)